MNDQIKQAIERSITHNEIVSVTIDGDSDDAIEAIESLIDTATTETDHVVIDGETLDVWAAEIGAPDGDMAWRLSITFENRRTCDVGE